MKDFTIKKYRELLESLIQAGYSFQRFDDFLANPQQKSIVLRHDVDLLPHNSLEFAKIQKEFNIQGTYYFRAVPQSWDENIIKEISDMGHEIGYHYESLTTCRGNLTNAFNDFSKNLTNLRKIAPVKTICMHGSPASKYDSKDIWKKYNYKDLEIIGEPYFDTDFTQVFYLTDTGRKWDGNKVSVRDRVKTSFNQSFHSTDEIILSSRRKELPQKIMFTFHPQRWTDSPAHWYKELVMQNVKNLIKECFFVKK